MVPKPVWRPFMPASLSLIICESQIFCKRLSVVFVADDLFPQCRSEDGRFPRPRIPTPVDGERS